MRQGNPIVKRAIAIARDDLRWCYRKRGIISGSRLVYWSWDSFFAGMGAVCLEDYPVVKRNLSLYLSLQNSEGSIPKRIAHPLYWMQYIGVPLDNSPKKQRPTFWNSYFTAESLAQDPIFIIAIANYAQATGDWEFVRKHLQQLYCIVEFLKRHEDGRGLLKEGLGGGWAESVLKRGAIAFTNMCYARSVYCLAQICQHLGDEVRAQHYREKWEKTKLAINLYLWSDEDGGHYSDWLSHHRHHHFATDGNLLAILWDIATPEQAAKIQAKITELALEDDIPIRLAYDKYNFWRIYIFNRIGGIKDYHVGFSWTWLGCIDAMVKLKMGYKEEAETILHKIASVIVRDGTVQETYNHGQPVRTFFYKSEHPWAWGAGLFILACHTLGYEVVEKS